MLHGSFVKASFSANKAKETAERLPTNDFPTIRDRDEIVDYFVRRL